MNTLNIYQDVFEGTPETPLSEFFKLRQNEDQDILYCAWVEAGATKEALFMQKVKDAYYKEGDQCTGVKTLLIKYDELSGKFSVDKNTIDVLLHQYLTFHDPIVTRAMFDDDVLVILRKKFPLPTAKNGQVLPAIMSNTVQFQD